MRRFRDNVFVQVFRDAAHGHVIAEFAVASLVGAGLIVAWSFAFVASAALLRGPSEGDRAHYPGLGRSTRPPAPTHIFDVGKQSTKSGCCMSGLGFDSRRLHHGGALVSTGSKRTMEIAGKDSRKTDQNQTRQLLVAEGGLNSSLRDAGSLGRRNQRVPPHLHAIVTAAAGDHDVPPHILSGLVEDESSWRPSVKGKNGEVGLLQLKQPVATWCGIKDRRDPVQNASCGARYLAAQFATFQSWPLAIVAFKAGPASIPENIPATSWAYAQRALQRSEAYR